VHFFLISHNPAILQYLFADGFGFFERNYRLGEGASRTRSSGRRPSLHRKFAVVAAAANSYRLAGR